MDDLIKPLDSGEKGVQKVNVKLVMAVAAILVLGIGSGWLMANFAKGGKGITIGLNKDNAKTVTSAGEEIKVGETYGKSDQSFKDSAVGVIEKNGKNGEGTHRLLREGGESQTAYLTSSVLDLDDFVSRKVEVHGETFAAQKVGWLMDVGSIKILE